MVNAYVAFLLLASCSAWSPAVRGPALNMAARSPAAVARPALPASINFARMMAEETEAATEAAAAAEVCIEDEAVEECILAEWPAGQLKVPQTWVNTAKLGSCFFAWFFLNVMYNITNKKCQNAFPMPWTMTVVSLFVGVPYILLLWASGLRAAPKLDKGWWKT